MDIDFGPKHFISQQQRDFYYSLGRFKYPAFVSGYGGGKTYCGCWKALLLSVLNPGVDGIIAEPTYPMMERILWPTLFNKILNDELGLAGRYTFNKVSKYVDLPWKSRIWFYSTEQPEKLVGSNAGWAYMDEAGLMKHLAFKNINSRIRDKRAKVSLVFTTFTPEAGGWTHECWGRRELFGEDLDPEYELWQGTTEDNWENREGYYEELLEMWGPEEAQARIYGKFVSSRRGRAYYTFDRKNIDTEEQYAVYQPGKPIWISFDFNQVPGMHAVAYQRNGWRHCFIDESHHLRGLPGAVEGLTLEGCCNYWVANYAEKHTGTVYVAGDASGMHSASRQNYYTIIQDIFRSKFKGKIVLRVPNDNPDIEERVMNANRLLCNAKGYRYICINPKCKRLLTDLETQLTEAARADVLGRAYKGEHPNHPSKDDIRIGHAGDSFGYILWQVDPLQTRFERAKGYA